ncbi:hypothetical protein AK88_05322, partial [Plasmodium fragile]
DSVINVESSAKSKAPTSNPIIKAVDNNKGGNVGGDVTHGNVNSGANNSNKSQVTPDGAVSVDGLKHPSDTIEDDPRTDKGSEKGDTRVAETVKGVEEGMPSKVTNHEHGIVTTNDPSASGSSASSSSTIGTGDASDSVDTGIGSTTVVTADGHAEDGKGGDTFPNGDSTGIPMETLHPGGVGGMGGNMHDSATFSSFPDNNSPKLTHGSPNPHQASGTSGSYNPDDNSSTTVDLATVSEDVFRPDYGNQRRNTIIRDPEQPDALNPTREADYLGSLAGDTGDTGAADEAGASGYVSLAPAGKDAEVDNGTDTKPGDDSEEVNTRHITEVPGTQSTDDSRQGPPKAQIDIEKDAEAEGASATPPRQAVGISPSVYGVSAPNSRHSEDGTLLSTTESLESNGNVYRTTSEPTQIFNNKNGSIEMDLQNHDFENDDMWNEEINSDQTIDIAEHHEDSNKNDNTEMRKHISKGAFTKDPSSNHLNSLNNLSNVKLDIKGYEHRDVNATRQEIIYLSEVHKCDNSISLMYCKYIEDRMSSSSCSTEKSKNLCCSISDFCLKYFVVASDEYFNCMKREFEDPSYKCFTKGSFRGMYKMMINRRACYVNKKKLSLRILQKFL